MKIDQLLVPAQLSAVIAPNGFMEIGSREILIEAAELIPNPVVWIGIGQDLQVCRVGPSLRGEQVGILLFFFIYEFFFKKI